MLDRRRITSDYSRTQTGMRLYFRLRGGHYKRIFNNTRRTYHATIFNNYDINYKTFKLKDPTLTL